MLPTSFENFDPLKGETPDFLECHYSEILQRARAILKGRTHKEILAITELLDWLSDGATLWEDAFAMLKEQAVQLDANGKVEGNYPEGKGLQAISFYMERIELDDNEFVENLAWPEIFAVHALQYVSLAIDEQVYQERIGLEPNNTRFFSILGSFAVDAMDAVCKAETLIEVQHGQESTIQQVKEKTSLKGQRNVFGKHKKYNTLYKNLVTFYRKGSFKKYTECVEEFLQITDEDDMLFLKKTNRVPQLTTVLSQLIRGKRTLPESAEDYKK